MAVFKSDARLLDAAGAVIGEGRAYVHLRKDAHEPHAVQGTMSLARWETDASAPATVELADGRRLAIRVEADALSACLGSSRILRYKAAWPPRHTPPGGGAPWSERA